MESYPAETACTVGNHVLTNLGSKSLGRFSDKIHLDELRLRLSLTFREDWLVLSNLLAQCGFKWEIDDQGSTGGRPHQIKVGFTLEKKRELLE